MLDFMLKQTSRKFASQFFKISTSSFFRGVKTISDSRFRSTCTSIFNEWNGRFMADNIPEPGLSAEFIVAHVMGCKMFYEVPKHVEVTNEQLEKINEYCEKRLERCPVQYIIGEWDFHDINLKMKPPVFIPRPETEELARLIAHDMESKIINNENPTFLEIGCGTGAISLHLLHRFSKISGVAVDKSKEACELTTENADRLGLSDRLQIINMDISKNGLKEKLKRHSPFDIVLSNPPYIPSDEMQALEREISDYEDHDALHGGPDGLDLVKCILEKSPSLMKSNGDLWLEVDVKHPKLIQNIVNSQANLGLLYSKTYLDFTSRERFCQLKRPQDTDSL